MKTVHPSQFLKFALLADATVSGAVAGLQLLLTGFLTDLLALPSALLVETGAFLVVYAILLFVLARSARVWSALIAAIVLGNIGWALACVALLLSGAVAPSALGLGFVAIQVVAVLVFALLEFKGLQASTPAGLARPAAQY